MVNAPQHSDANMDKTSKILPLFTFIRLCRRFRHCAKQLNFACLKRLIKVNGGSSYQWGLQTETIHFRVYAINPPLHKMQ